MREVGVSEAVSHAEHQMRNDEAEGCPSGHESDHVARRHVVECDENGHMLIGKARAQLSRSKEVAGFMRWDIRPPLRASISRGIGSACAAAGAACAHRGRPAATRLARPSPMAEGHGAE
jgi:hypothetical protein